jgi:orotate phosphoribosyltransferase-like protein
LKLHRTGYSGRIYESAGLREHAEFVLKTLDKLQGQFDFVVATGKSGMSVAFAALAMGADFDLVTIRKGGESSHGSKVEGIANGTRYVVVDDLIDTGATLNRVARNLRQFATEEWQEHPRMVAAILYGNGRSSRNRDEYKVDGQSEPIQVYGAFKE